VTVSRVTIHHEGPPGTPTDNVARFKPEGYTYGIGVTRWELFRTPEQSFGTWNHNGTSVDVCLSGNRMVAPITDNDLALIEQACADARARGWLTPLYTTYPHGNIYPVPAGYPPGGLGKHGATQCPGTLTIARWPEVVAATRPHVMPPPTPAPKEHDEMITFVRDPVTGGLFMIHGNTRRWFADGAAFERIRAHYLLNAPQCVIGGNNVLAWNRTDIELHGSIGPDPYAT
jgi:hypothetical protein